MVSNKYIEGFIKGTSFIEFGLSISIFFPLILQAFLMALEFTCAISVIAIFKSSLLLKLTLLFAIFLLYELQCTTDVFNDCPGHFNAIIGLDHAQSFYQLELQGILDILKLDAC